MRKRALRMSRSAKSVNKIKEAINTISEIASQIQKI
jgi:methyl-accepting chemotaxis protein